MTQTRSEPSVESRGMSFCIRLLGRPTLDRDGEAVRLEGRKTWALLAYLLLQRDAPTRRELVERLWSDADDPLAAMRWTLSQVRRALAPDVRITEHDGRLSLAGDRRVDALEVLGGAWDDETVDDAARGELLEGIDAGPPEFERWLSVQRARLASARIDTIRARASVLVHAEPLRALELAERALTAAPFDDALHQLVVDCHLARGDRTHARAYVTSVDELYRRELGVPAPRALNKSLERADGNERPITFGFAFEARALLDTAVSRGSAGAWDDARQMAMRAIDAAVAADDRVLEVRGLLQLTTVLTCELDGGPAAWTPLLQRALAVASELEDEALLADVEIARARIASIEARYGAAEAILRRALPTAERLGDELRLSRIHGFLGICATDRADYSEAERELRIAAALIPGRPENASVWLARCLLLAGRLDEADAIAREAIASMRERGVVFQLPLAQIVAAEVLRARGSLAQASELFAAAFTLSREISDIDWSTLALRGLAWIDRAEGRPERALATLRDAAEAAMRHLGCIRWVRAAALTDLVEWERGADANHLRQALRLAHAAPMPEFAARLAPFVDDAAARPISHTPAHTLAS